MRLDQALESIPGFVVPAELDRFRRHIDPALIEEALHATGTATVRRRRMPAEQVVWLLVGMALFRNESIERVAALLDLSLPSSDGKSVARSGLTQARQRLGDEPLDYLFTITADRWAHASAAAHRFRGLSVYALDGTTLRVPDSRENWKAFGGQVGSGERGGSAYPLVRMVALMAARSHLLAAVRIGDYATGETTLARGIEHELPDDSLLLIDRNFLVADDLTRLVATGRDRHFMTRAKTTTRMRVIKRFGKNDALVEIQLSEGTRKAHPNLPPVWQVRAIGYRKKGFPPSTVLTSLVDADKYPAAELVALYHERWEVELGYDEIKTHMLERQEAIRSRTPDGVRQELLGVALAYNLIRLEMEGAADELGVEPNRISFVNAMALIRNAWLIWSTPPLAPGRIPAALIDLRRYIKLLVLPPRRAARSYPRLVKIKMSNYNRKPPTGKGRK